MRRGWLLCGLILGVGAGACRGRSPEPPRYQTKVHPPLMVQSATVSPGTTASGCHRQTLKAHTTHVPSSPGVKVMITHIAAPAPTRGAVLLMHGAGSPSSSIWDLNHEDYSVMRRLACEGFDTYALDARGFGGSDKPPKDASGQPGAVRAKDVMQDMAAAVAFARQTSKVETVDLVGWSWGCVVTGMYAGLHPEQIHRLALFAPVYDRKWPTRHAKKPEWKPVDRALFYKFHDPDKESRAVLDLHVQQLFQYADPDGVLRLSNGPYADIYGERPIWDPGLVQAPTLVLRGDADRASQAEPAAHLLEALTHAPVRRHEVLPKAGHFAFRTHNYRAFQDALVRFLTASAP